MEHSLARSTGVAAVDRAIEILRALGDLESANGITLVELAERTDIPRSTVHRILQSLIESNLVMSTRPTGGLRLGSEFVRLASISGSRVVPVARPHLFALSKKVDAGVTLAVLEGASVRFLDQVISSHGIRAVSLVGSTLPAHSTANGKALLAELSERTVIATLPNRLARLTPNTIVDRDSMFAEFGRIRREGVAYDLEENDLGISAIGTTVHDVAGNAAAIVVALPTDRFHDRAAFYRDEIVHTAREVDRALRAERISPAPLVPQESVAIETAAATRNGSSSE